MANAKKYFVADFYNNEYEGELTLKDAEAILNNILNDEANKEDILIFDEADALKIKDAKATIVVK